MSGFSELDLELKEQAAAEPTHSCKKHCSSFEAGRQEMYDHLKPKLDLADRMACFIKNKMGFISGDWKQDAKELLDAYFNGDKN